MVKKAFGVGMTEASLAQQNKDLDALFTKYLDYGLNQEFNPRNIVGDDPNDLIFRHYGNNDYEGPNASHGTHVAGIVAAVRNNNIGIRGVADHVRIMSVRCVPNGDERDKDVAFAIRYAVDNGAGIISMSLGKFYSPRKWFVDEAVKYARKHDVLIVHAAGNDHSDNDLKPVFPSDTYTKKGLFGPKHADNWIEVGALNWKKGAQRVGDFSNYGKTSVDLFSPGVDIWSTVTDNTYGSKQGTSMATPAVSGVAAILRAYFPQLSAQQVRAILLDSVIKLNDIVIKPGTEDEMVPFSELSSTGGVVSATRAVQLAARTRPKMNHKAFWRSEGLKQ